MASSAVGGGSSREGRRGRFGRKQSQQSNGHGHAEPVRGSDSSVGFAHNARALREAMEERNSATHARVNINIEAQWRSLNSENILDFLKINAGDDHKKGLLHITKHMCVPTGRDDRDNRLHRESIKRVLSACIRPELINRLIALRSTGATREVMNDASEKLRVLSHAFFMLIHWVKTRDETLYNTLGLNNLLLANDGAALRLLDCLGIAPKVSGRDLEAAEKSGGETKKDRGEPGEEEEEASSQAVSQEEIQQLFEGLSTEQLVQCWQIVPTGVLSSGLIVRGWVAACRAKFDAPQEPGASTLATVGGGLMSLGRGTESAATPFAPPENFSEMQMVAIFSAISDRHYVGVLEGSLADGVPEMEKAAVRSILFELGRAYALLAEKMPTSFISDDGIRSIVDNAGKRSLGVLIRQVEMKAQAAEESAATAAGQARGRRRQAVNREESIAKQNQARAAAAASGDSDHPCYARNIYLAQITEHPTNTFLSLVEYTRRSVFAKARAAAGNVGKALHCLQEHPAERDAETWVGNFQQARYGWVARQQNVAEDYEEQASSKLDSLQHWVGDYVQKHEFNAPLTMTDLWKLCYVLKEIVREIQHDFRRESSALQLRAEMFGWLLVLTHIYFGQLFGDRQQAFPGCPGGIYELFASDDSQALFQDVVLLKQVPEIRDAQKYLDIVPVELQPESEALPYFKCALEARFNAHRHPEVATPVDATWLRHFRKAPNRGAADRKPDRRLLSPGGVGSTTPR